MLQNILYLVWTLVHHHSFAILCWNITLPYKESWSVHACAHAPVCVLLLVCISVKWRSGQPALNCAFSKEQEVPETERLVFTYVARQHVSHTWGRDAVQSHCSPARLLDSMSFFFFFLKFLSSDAVSSCNSCYLLFADEKSSVFLPSLHRMKQKQRQNLGRTRFCLRAHGYVADQIISSFSPSSPVTIHASLLSPFTL